MYQDDESTWIQPACQILLRLPGADNSSAGGIPMSALSVLMVESYKFLSCNPWLQERILPCVWPALASHANFFNWQLGYLSGLQQEFTDWVEQLNHNKVHSRLLIAKQRLT